MRKTYVKEEYKSIRVLLVDDDQNFLETLKCQVEKAGFTDVRTTDDCDEAINIVKNDNINILVVDYLLIGETGVQLTVKVREFNSNVYIILLTGHANLMPYEIAIRKYEIDSYANKEADFQDVLLKIEIGAKSLLRYFNNNKEHSNDVIDGQTFPERLKHFREKANIKQKDLAESLGVGRTTITNYELGVNEPTLKHLRKIAEYFNISYNDLIGETSKKD